MSPKSGSGSGAAAGAATGWGSGGAAIGSASKTSSGGGAAALGSVTMVLQCGQRARLPAAPSGALSLRPHSGHRMLIGMSFPFFLPAAIQLCPLLVLFQRELQHRLAQNDLIVGFEELLLDRNTIDVG